MIEVLNSKTVDQISAIVDAALRVACDPSPVAYRTWGVKQVYSGDLRRLLQTLYDAGYGDDYGVPQRLHAADLAHREMGGRVYD